MLLLFHKCRSSLSMFPLLALLLLLLSAGAQEPPSTTSSVSSSLTLPASAHPHQLLRALALGDYDEFNKLFQDASVALPDAETSKNGLKLTIRNLVCSEISIGDMQTNFTQENAKTLVYGLFLNPFNFVCRADYSYKYSFFVKGSGRLTAKAHQNRAEAKIAFTSPTTFRQDPPSTTQVQSCKTHIDIYDMSFKGGIVAKVLDLLEDAIDGVIEKEVESTVCSELQALESLLNGFLQSTGDRVSPYLQPIPAKLADPLQAEIALKVPKGTDLVNFNKNWLDQVLAQADLLLGEVVEDTNNRNNPGATTDLAVNVLLRNRVLDSDGALSIKSADITSFNPVLFEGHDFLTESSITLDALRVFGLDSLGAVDPLNIIGKYTVQNLFQWDYLKLELDMTVRIKPSTKPDALIQNPNQVEIVEQIGVKFGFNNIALLVSFMFAMDVERINQIPLGSVLKSDNLFSCFIKSLFRGSIAGLDFSVTSIDDPTLEGFISKGIDRFISESVEAVFTMYEPTFVRAMPYIFQDMVRGVLQESVLDPMLADEKGENCPQETWPKGALDFRDLFLSPDAALRMGGSGTAPYGDIANIGYDMAMSRITEIGLDGSPMVNEMVIRPVTESQSGQQGSLAFEKALFSLARNNISSADSTTFGELVDRFEIRLSDMRINHLDKIVAPLVLLEPTTEMSVLNNAITIGNSTTEQLTVVLRLLLALEGRPPFNMLNEIDLSASVDSLALNTEIGALMDGAMISQFPLLNLLEFDCWVASLSSDDVKATIQGLSVETFESILSSLNLDAKCTSCSSEGTKILPDIVDMVQDSGASSTLQTRLPRFLADVVESDWLQDTLDQWIMDAPAFCSFLPEYSEGATRTGLSGLPTLKTESVDTLLYTSFLAGWVGFLVFAENQRQQEFEPSDPLSAQKTFVVEKGAELLDWNNIGNSTGLGTLGDAAFEQVRQYLGSSDSSGSPTINSLLENFLDDSGKASFGFDEAVFQNDGLVFAIDSITLEGLDSVEYVDVLKPIGDQTLQNSIRLGSLGADIKLRVGYENTSDPDKEVTVQLAFENISLDASVFAAFDVARLRSLPLSAVLKVDHVLPCFLSTMFDLQVPQFVVSVGSFATPVVKGLEGDTSTSMRRFLQSTMEKFGEDLVESVPRLFEGITKELSSALLSSAGDNAECPEPTLSSSTGLVDFRDLLLPKEESVEYGGSGTVPYGDAIRMLWEFIEENIISVDPETGLSPINKEIIAPFTEKRSGVPGRYTFGDLFDQATRVNVGGLDAKLNLGAYDTYVENLDSIGAPLSIIDPIRGLAHQLNNTASAGVGNPVRLGGRFVFELIGADSAIKNDVELSMSLEKITVVLQALIKVLEPAFLGLPIEAIGNWRCWLAMMPAPSLDRRGVRTEESETSLSLLDLGLSVAELGLNVSCIECTGPDMQRLVERLSEPGAVNETTRVANDVLDYATQLLEGDYLQVVLDRLVVDSRKRCPVSPEYVENAPPSEYAPFQSIILEDSFGFLVALAVTMVSLATLLSILLLAIRMFVRRRHRKWIRTLSPETLSVLVAEQKKDDEHALQINESSVSLFESRGIPRALRYGVPVIILGNIAFFLSGHLSLGGSISIVFSLAGESYVAGDFFDFSMAKSALEIWNAGGKELAMLLFIFSGVWPYSKQLITLGLWFAPPRLVSVSRRENILLWLDSLAKWSMLDIFVLVLTIAAFRVSVKSPDVAFLPDGFYSLDLLVVPKWGLYANMIAQLISQISSHFIIHYHRKVVRQAETARLFARSTVLMEVEDAWSGSDGITEDGLVREGTGSEQSEERERLCEHAFSRPHRGECDRLVPRSFVNKGLVSIFIFMSALIIAGCSVPSYSLDILGIVGILVESGQKFAEATSYYNIFSTVGLLLDQAAFTGKVGDYLGLGTLSTILVLTALFVPLVQSVALMYMWFMPISRRRRYRLMIAMETLAAWQYAEVYFFSAIVGSWQLGSVSEYIINAYCGSLSGRFAQLVYYGVLKEDDAQCFRVDVNLEPGLFLLAAGSILLALINAFVLKSVRQYDHDKFHSERLEQRNEKSIMASSSGGYGSDEELDKIHPVPVMFTDTFRWLLRRQHPALRVVPTGNSSGEDFPPSMPKDQIRSVESFEGRLDEEDQIRSVESFEGRLDEEDQIRSVESFEGRLDEEDEASLQVDEEDEVSLQVDESVFYD